MALTLFVVHGSHPCATVERALELKGLRYRRIEWPPPLHAPAQLLLFGARTVPAARLPGGETVIGSRAIVRRLEDLAPSPALYPSEPDARRTVDCAEEWGDEVYQPIARRLLWAAVRRRPQALASYSQGSRLRLPARVIVALSPLASRAEVALHHADEGAVRSDLRNLPHHLERIDRWIANGVLGGEAPNAADLQIAATSRLLLTIGDVRAFLAGRPAGRHARRVFAPQPGWTPPGLFPPAWVAGSPPRA